MKNRIYRYDSGEVRSAHYTPEGFLSVDAIVTRTGIFLYRNMDGSLRRELRHPDEVHKKESLDSMKMLPITLMHPKEKIVDASNAGKLTKGFTGENITIDGKYIINKLLITNQDAIDAVVSGLRQLSLGYTIERIDEDGTYDDARFDAKQTNIIYNHLAIVPSARAGDGAAIHLDNNDSFQCLMPPGGTCIGNCNACQYAISYIGDYNIDNKEFAKKTTKINTDSTKKQTKENRMKKIVIDGIEYEAAPEVINAFNKEKERADTSEAELKTSKEANTKLQASLDESKDKLKKAEEATNDEAVQKAVAARLELVSSATPHLDEETVKKIQDMSDREIKVAVIKAHYETFDAEGKDDVYIDARYDGALELDSKKSDSTMSQQRKTVNGDKSQRKDNNDEPDQEKSRHDMIESMKNAWKGKTGTDD